MGDAAKRWNKAVEDPSALMDLRTLIENGAPIRAQPELDAENEQLKMDAAFAANMCGMADKDRAVAMAASNLLRAKLEKWESIFGETDPEKVRMTRLEYDLRSERLVASELTKRIAELEQEVERLKAAMAAQNDEIAQGLGKALGYPWYKDDPANFPGATEADGVCVGEHVAETIAHEAANRIATLLAELAKAPQWVPVDDCVESEMECTYQVVHGTIQSCLGVKPFIYREAYYEQGEWSAGGMPVCVTHVLANLNPPNWPAYTRRRRDRRALGMT